MAQASKHNESHAVTETPKAPAPDEPVKTIADEQRERSAAYEANLGKASEAKK